MPFCACVCPYAYAYALVKTRPTLFRLKTHTFDARRPSVHTNTMSVFIENARVDQNENAYISCWCGHSTTHQNENNDRKYRRRVCWYHGHGVKIKSQHSILSFLNVLVLIVENASKRQCGRESINKNALVWFEKDRIARCKRTCSPALPDLCLLLMSTHIFRKFEVFLCVAETTVDSWLVSYCVVMSFQCMNYVMW